MNQRLDKWIRWLKVIHDEVQQLLIARDIFWSVQDLVNANKAIQKPSSFYQYLGDTYISHVLIGIRRQVKFGGQSISFARLLDEMAKSPETLSREYFVDLYEGSVVAENANDDFDRFCEAAGMDHISSAMVSADLKQLRSDAEKCESFADRRVAHRDTRDPSHPLTFKEIDDVVDALDKLYVKYHLIFHAGAMDSLMPTYQYDWQEIFDERWRLPEL